jgi:hypothetical protein
MDDDSRSLLEHPRRKCAINADSGEQVGIDRLLPIVVGEGQRAAARCRRAADIVDEDVQRSDSATSGNVAGVRGPTAGLV